MRSRYWIYGLTSLALLSASPVLSNGGPQPIWPDAFKSHDPQQVRAGWLLFYDPILSGNRNISCGTCHHPNFATSDGLALGLGEGGQGLGPARTAVADNLPEQRIPRNSPALFNLGHRDITVMFHDGRIEVDESRASGLRTPLGDDMTTGFASLLSAQTMFPVLSADEMAGHYQENDVSKAVRQGRLSGEGGAWDIIANRVDEIAAYRDLFSDFDAEIAGGSPIKFTDISDAIAAFIDTEWRADQSPYDIALRGGPALPQMAADGMDLFFGEANCSACHSGPLLSDQKFHAMADPQIGPGKAARFETHQEDVGRMRVTGSPDDAYAFRTPMLRNVTQTGPWGHAGAHDRLGEYIRYHANPVAGLSEFEPNISLTALPGAAPDYAVLMDSKARGAIKAAYDGAPVDLSSDDIAALLAFLNSLTDSASIKGKRGIPDAVPSGLPVDR